MIYSQIIRQERFTTSGWKTSQSNNGVNKSALKIKEEPVSPEHHNRLPKRRHDSDESPPRRRHDSDESPPRRRHDSDESPPRRRHDSDESPPRRRHDSDESLPRRSIKSDSDSSPPRKIKREVDNDDDLSPPRNIKQEGNDSDISPPRQIKQEIDDDGDLSLPRASSSLMSKTLAGKKAGLQDAKSLKEEMIKLKQKEKRTFDNVSLLLRNLNILRPALIYYYRKLAVIKLSIKLP